MATAHPLEERADDPDCVFCAIQIKAERSTESNGTGSDDKVLWWSVDRRFSAVADLHPDFEKHFLLLSRNHVVDFKAILEHRAGSIAGGKLLRELRAAAVQFIRFLDNSGSPGGGQDPDDTRKDEVEDSSIDGDAIIYDRETNETDLNSLPEGWRMGFHLPPFNSIPHLHLHVFSGAKTAGFLHSTVAFTEGTPWYLSIDNAIRKAEAHNSKRSCMVM